MPHFSYTRVAAIGFPITTMLQTLITDSHYTVDSTVPVALPDPFVTGIVWIRKFSGRSAEQYLTAFRTS
jgi:hypothetical protein